MSKRILIRTILFFIILFSVFNSFELTINNDYNTKYTYYLSIADNNLNDAFKPLEAESNIFVTQLHVKTINHIDLMTINLKEKTDYQNLNKYNNFLNIIKVTNAPKYKTSWKAVYVIAVSLAGLIFLILCSIKWIVVLIYQQVDNWNINIIRVCLMTFLSLIYLLGAIYNPSIYKFQNDSDDLTYASFYLKDNVNVGQVKIYNQDKKLYVDQLLALNIKPEQITKQCDIAIINQGLCYLPYNSSFGAQAYVFKYIGKGFNLSLNQFIRCCQVIELFLLALVLTELIIVFYRAYGKTVFLSTLIGISSTYILAKFAPSVYWNLWIVILPFLISSKYMLDKGSRLFQNKPLFLIGIFFIFLLKMLFGYEWLSSIVLSTMIPLIWNGKSISYRSNFKLIVYVGILSLLAFIISIFLWWAKLGNHEFYNSIISDVVRRVSFLQGFGLKPVINVLDINDPTYLESLHVSLGIVLGKLILRQDFFLFLGFYVLILLCGYGYYWGNKKGLITKQLKQLYILTAVSLVAPLSWYILAKPHSYVHVFLNYFLWFLPTGFYIYVLVGIILHMFITKKTHV